MAKCRASDKAMAPTRYRLRHIGKVNKEADDERALAALSISIKTRIEREIVEAVREDEDEGEKIEQSIGDEKELHEWK